MLAILVTPAEATDSRIWQVTENQVLIQQEIQLLAYRMDQQTSRIDQLTVRVDHLTDQVGNLALQMEHFAQQAKQDRSQATLDRAEFRSTVQPLLEVLTQQDNDNGRTEE